MLDDTLNMGMFLLGITLVIIGLILLIWEVHMPGFFIAVPGTIIIVLGVCMMFMENLNVFLTSVLIIISSIFASIFTLLFYRHLGKPQPPETTTIEKLVGKTGVVIKKIEPNSIKGKVKIDGDSWSATSSTEIDVGKKVVVVGGEGVHLYVKEVK